jgi:hypothetical protein
MRATCENCFKSRNLKRVTGPGLPPKGRELCRPCFKALKFAAKVNSNG